MTADLKAARADVESRIEIWKGSGYPYDRRVAASLSTLLTALDQAAEALTNAEEDLSVIHRAATHCQGKFGGRMSEVDRVFQEITRVSSMHKVRAATVYATLKPEGEG